MYKPIRNIVGVFTGYEQKRGQDEFSFIRETALNIKKANDTLRETIPNNRLPLKHKFLRDLLIGLIPAEKIAPQIEKYELNTLRQEQTVVVMEFVNKNHLEDHFSKEAVQEIKSQTMTIIEEQLKQDTECEWLEWDDKRCVLIMREADMVKMKKLLNNSLSGIEIDFEIRIVASIGKPVRSVNEIEQSFHAALDLLEHRIVADHRTVITLHDLEFMKQISYFYPLDLERDLIRCPW